MQADQLGTDQMSSYREKRIAQDASRVTINRELQVLRKAYRLAVDATPPKVRTVPKFQMSAEDNARKVFMSEDVKQRLKDAAAKEGLWMRVFMEMIFSLGWRKGEVIGLHISNVHLAEGFIRIEHSKSGEQSEAPLTNTLRVLLEPLVIGKNPDDRLFPVKDVRHAWRRVCKGAGVKAGRKDGYIIHDTRRTCARTKRAAQVSESVTMDLLGWKTPAMFRRYGIVDRADRLEALQRSEQWEQDQKKAAEREQRTATKQLQSKKTLAAGIA